MLTVQAPRRRRLVRTGGVLVGLGVVALLLRALGVAPVMDHLRRVGWGFLWMLAAYLFASTLYSLPLGVVLPPEARPSSWALCAGRVAAVAVNAATPFLGLGGEPARLLWLRPEVRSAGVAGLFVDRAAFLFASALFLVGGAAAAALRLPVPEWMKLTLLGVAGLALGLAVALYLLQRRGAVAMPIARLVCRLSGRLLLRRTKQATDQRTPRDRLLAFATEMDQRIQRTHVNRPRRFVVAVSLHLAGRCASALEVFVGARLLGMEVGAVATLILTAVPVAVDLVFSFVPSQIGFNEGTNALLAETLGFDPAAGMALAFLQRLRQVVFVSLGFALLTLKRPRRQPSEAAAG